MMIHAPSCAFVAATRVWVTDPKESPYRIEWLRYERDSYLDEDFKNTPHVAFIVDELEPWIAGKEFAINCDLVQSWTGSGDEFTIARFSAGDPITVQGAFGKILRHVSKGTVETDPLGHATPPAFAGACFARPSVTGHGQSIPFIRRPFLAEHLLLSGVGARPPPDGVLRG